MTGSVSRRLDLELVKRSLASSRTKAQEMIRAGRVTVEGAVADKPALLVEDSTTISVSSGDDYVSRGAYKLLGAFDAFAQCGLVQPKGMDCLDIGASTGGFTDVLLRLGANRVIALDVGHGQLAPRIAADPRVIELSGVNIRDVKAADLPFVPKMVVSDVSFISLRYVIPVIREVTKRGAHIVLLVKPQFEVGRGKLGSHGVVADEGLRRQAVETVAQCAANHGCEVIDTVVSPVLGARGNVEYLLYARRL